MAASGTVALLVGGGAGGAGGGHPKIICEDAERMTGRAATAGAKL